MLSARDSGLMLAIPGLRPARIDVGHSAYQITAGGRGLDLLGAEIDYFDLGSGPSSALFPTGAPTETLMNARIAQKGEAAFAMLYLPVPVIDVYLKAGVARITTHLSGTAIVTCFPGGDLPGIQPDAGERSFQHDRDDVCGWRRRPMEIRKLGEPRRLRVLYRPRGTSQPHLSRRDVALPVGHARLRCETTRTDRLRDAHGGL